jgi:DnaJ-class molecular chaperone
MKIVCEECRGTGTVTCPECDGQGTYEGGIEEITLVSNMHNYEELNELQKDASRVIRQAARLKELNPGRAESYAAQLKATLFVINGQAETAANKL